MFHVEPNAATLAIKRISMIFLMVFVFISCIKINKNTEIADYQILNPQPNSITKKPKTAAFIFENEKNVRSFQDFLASKYNTRENRDFPITIQDQKFTLSVLDKSEIELYITAEDLILRYREPVIVKTGERQNYVAIQVTDKFGADCLKNDSIFHNLVVNYLKELKIEFSKS